MSEKPKLPRSVLVLNIIMIVIIVAICALGVSLVYSPALLGEESSAPPTVEVSLPETGEAEGTTATTTTTAATTSVSMTKASTSDWYHTIDSSSVPEQSSTADPLISVPVDDHYEYITAYDKEYFADDLFIGDSITTGIHLYNKLDMKNVAASVGYTPYKAYTEACDLYDGTSKTALEYAKSMQPKRIYIMLGSNGLLSAGAMEDSYNTLIDKLKEACPDSELYCISVTPVAQYTDYEITNDMVRDFNSFIKSACGLKGVTYVDFYSVMITEDGYANAELVADDGLHFNGSTYDIMLSFIQNM